MSIYNVSVPHSRFRYKTLNNERLLQFQARVLNMGLKSRNADFYLRCHHFSKYIEAELMERGYWVRNN
jgi:hypothetical protein